MSALLEEVRARHRAFLPEVAKAIRIAAGVSQPRLAAELGVHPMTVYRWEAGTRTPTSSHLVAYVDLLEQLRAVSAA
ncbi:helix-turn-helix transcriptional regulator [Jatrophihabitans sp.]|uniref:helix-turn-helix domain-containing protein n=1 Tax=Jatrophihabitans sp. TaxID=1932789 RepID=UPI0030C684B5|nr:hypothetical protein [Jatrophihabitans sp.]